MTKFLSAIILNSFLICIGFAQSIDSTQAQQDTTLLDTTRSSIILKKKAPLFLPTMPQLPRMKEDKASINLDIRSQNRSGRPEESTNYDAMNLPPDRYDYPLQREYAPILVPVTPINPQKDILKPLPFSSYILPNRAELEVLDILWAKEDVQDTTIYSCLDTVLNITMMDLNQLLEGMTRKGLVSRKIVSPRNEFNAFGVLIEMSPTNRRNRIYEYHTLVDRELMQSFIDANNFLFKRDSSIVNFKGLEAAKKDSTLLNDLNKKIQRVQK
jgi:hypothetical protein